MLYFMYSEYYSKDSLINVLKTHLLEQDINRVDWDSVINDGEIYPKPVEGVSGCYIYSIPAQDSSITVFIHPTVCTELYFDAWTDKEVYMGRKEGEIW